MANETYDVFVSYSRADWQHAAEIDSVLRAKGLRSFFDRRNLAPGLPWVRALEQAIGAAGAVIVLIGPRGLGNTQQYERELALVRQSRDPAFPVVPVILPETASDRPFDFLNLLTWVDFSHVAKVSDAPDELARLLAAVHGASSPGDVVREAICPYRGLDAFREEDAAFFFGRGSASEPDSPIGQLVRKVREHPFVMVVGRSGSGKSSLVYAGLLPALRRGRDRFWNVISLQPTDTPLHALAAAFNVRAEGEGAAKYASKIDDDAKTLRAGDPELLSRMIGAELDRAEGKPDRLLLYIDQWEELYAQASSSGDSERATQHAADVNRFIDLVLTAARTAPVTVVATVRADFYDPLIAHPEIRSLLPTRQVLLGAMPRSELERTIVEPARKVGLAFDPPDLVQRILDEAGEDEGMLPLLEYALKETWALRKGNTITADSYARSGGVREAIRKTAERTFEVLSAEDQQAARQLFLRLVIPGEGQEDTRARAAMPLEPMQLKIVELFAGPRTRLLVTGFDRARRPTVEVAHEALIRTWPRFRCWIDANREKLRARGAVLQAKADWEQSGRRDDMLLAAGLPLERARTLLADPGDITTDDIKEFISLSLKRAADAQRKRLRRNIALAAVSFLAVAGVLLSLWAEINRGEALVQREAAERNFAVAKQGADALIYDIAQSLRFQEGVRIETIRIILGRAGEVIGKLVVSSGDNPELQLSQANMLAQFAITYATQGDTEMSEQAARRSVDIARRRLAADSVSTAWQRTLAESASTLGDALDAKGVLDEAEASHRESLALTSALIAAEPQVLNWHHLQAIAHNKIGNLQRVRGNLAEALASHRRSLALMEPLAAADPANSQWRDDLATVHERVGRILREQGRLVDALASMNRSREILDRLAKAEPGNVRWQRGLAAVHQQVGSALVDLGKLSDAEQSYATSWAIIERLAKADPGNAWRQRDLASIIESLGDLQKTKGELAEALRRYEESHAIRTRIAAADPKNQGLQHALSLADEKLGSIYELQGNYRTALNHYEASLARMTPFRHAAPGNAQLARAAAVTHGLIGDVQRAMGDVAAAQANIEAGRMILERLVFGDPSNVEWQRGLAVADEKLAGIMQRFDGYAAHGIAHA